VHSQQSFGLSRDAQKIRGYFRDFVQFRAEPIQVCTVPYGINTRRVLGVFLYIYLIDVNLHYYQNNSRLSVDVGILSNHVKSVPLSLDLSFFDSIYCSSLLCAVTTIFQLIRPE
jgi:hypothetical protein